MSKAIVFRNRQNEKIYPCPYYPIGSIFLSVTNMNPATYFGGTWVQIQDRFLLCAGSTYSAGNTGGSATHKHTTSGHTLTVDEIPSHNHSMVNTNSGGSGSQYTVTVQYGKGFGWNLYTLNAGGGKSHSHGDTGNASSLPPYLVVYAWKRTA